MLEKKHECERDEREGVKGEEKLTNNITFVTAASTSTPASVLQGAKGQGEMGRRAGAEHVHKQTTHVNKLT